MIGTSVNYVNDTFPKKSTKIEWILQEEEKRFLRKHVTQSH